MKRCHRVSNADDEWGWLRIMLLIDFILAVVEFVLFSHLVVFTCIMAASLIGNSCLFGRWIKEHVNGHVCSVLNILVGRVGMIYGMKPAKSWSHLLDKICNQKNYYKLFLNYVLKFSVYNASVENEKSWGIIKNWKLSFQNRSFICYKSILMFR